MYDRLISSRARTQGSSPALTQSTRRALNIAPGAVFGLQGVLWLASIGLLLAACARWYPAGSESELGPPWTRAEGAIFLGLVALALVTYTAWLDDIPWRFHYDEGLAYIEAMRF